MQFSTCRNYSKAIQELKSVFLMKITTSIPLGIKLKDYKVLLQIGDVLVRDRANVRLDVQLLMIGWKALKENIIMPLHFVKAQWYFLVRIFSFNKARFWNNYFLLLSYSSLCSEIIPTQSSNLSAWWKSIFVLKLCRKEGWKVEVLAVCSANSI